MQGNYKKYVKEFRDTQTGDVFAVVESCIRRGNVTHLVLISLCSGRVVEVDNGYTGVTVKKVASLKDEIIECSIEEFDKRFEGVKEG